MSGCGLFLGALYTRGITVYVYDFLLVFKHSGKKKTPSSGERKNRQLRSARREGGLVGMLESLTLEEIQAQPKGYVDASWTKPRGMLLHAGLNQGVCYYMPD